MGQDFSPNFFLDFFKSLFTGNIRIFPKSIGRNLAKDILVFLVCLLLYIVFGVFLFTPGGSGFLTWAKSCTPFIKLLEDALADISMLLSLVFKSISLSSPTPIQFPVLSLVAISLDLCKMLLAAFIQNILFRLFSRVFLYSNNHYVSDILMGFDGKKDPLYFFNHGLLLGISILLGTFSGNWLIWLLGNSLQAYSLPWQHAIAITLFVIFFVGSSIFFSLTSKKHGAYTFFQALRKTALLDVTQELLIFLVTNLLLVMAFNCVRNYGLHWITLLAILICILWHQITDYIRRLALLLIVKRNLPYLGKKCPLSGIFCVFSVICIFLCYYLMVLVNLGPTDDFLENSLRLAPFLYDWVFHLVDIPTLIMGSFELHSTDLLCLLAACSILVALQHVSSTYKATLFTQIVVRALLMGLGMCLVVGCNILLFYVAVPFAAHIGYPGLVNLCLVILYIIFARFQPYWALQGLGATAGMIFTLHFLPALFFINPASINQNDLMYFGIKILVVVGLYLLFSFAQNLVAFFEKKARKAYTATDVAADAASLANAAKETCTAVSDAVPILVTATAVTAAAAMVAESAPEPAMPPRFCGTCGAPLAANSQFCGKCGKKS